MHQQQEASPPLAPKTGVTTQPAEREVEDDQFETGEASSTSPVIRPPAAPKEPDSKVVTTMSAASEGSRRGKKPRHLLGRQRKTWVV